MSECEGTGLNMMLLVRICHYRFKKKKEESPLHPAPEHKWMGLRTPNVRSNVRLRSQCEGTGPNREDNSAIQLL